MSSLRHTLATLIILASALSLSLLVRQPSNAQIKAADEVWSKVSESAFVIDTLIVKPTQYSAFIADVSKLQEILRTAPREFTPDARSRTVIITLPLPDGKTGRFKLEESPIIAPKLAARFPGLKSYSVKGLDDRTATGRLEFTSEGFRGMIISQSGTFAIDPANKSNARGYISYFKAQLPRDPSGFVCNVDNPQPPPIRPRARPTPTPPRPTPRRHHALPSTRDSDLRIYRIAIAASSEYSNAILQSNAGSTVDPLTQVMDAIQRTIDRVNAIYSRELGIRFELIADEEYLIYLNSRDDPYLNLTDPDVLLDKNQSNIDDVIGWDLYDVGHLFLAHGGGRSAQPCACSAWYKANGLTGRPNPQGDLFDVDYVAHELGHQFGAHHSFNGTTRNCRPRSADAAYEPGSGSTIMGYAGGSPPICGAESVQDHSDDYFHANSLREIDSFITNTNSQMGDSCARKVADYDPARPGVFGPGDFVIPSGTPFKLTAQEGWDDDGDVLLYNWEEFDFGDPDPPVLGDPNEVTKIRPLFRSLRWVAGSRTRIFPRMSDLLNPPPTTTYTAESLPRNNRTMVFRVTVRDQRGRYGYDDSQIRVVATRRTLSRGAGGFAIGEVPVGPFEVIAPPKNDRWRRLSWQTVRWNVANTNLAPVSCGYVRISLLSALHHPVVLAKKVRNRLGSAAVLIPANAPLGNARIKVEAWDNIFFNVAKSDIRIVR